MILRRAILVKGSSTPVGTGKTAPERALVRIDGQPSPAIIKRLQPECIAAECFAAIALSEWGIPVPEPLLVHDDEQLLFGSHEEEYPNLKHRLGWHERMSKAEIDALQIKAARAIAGFKQTPAAIAADEAIANHDRNLENILWDGGEPFFIDHERAFGAHLPDSNKLALLAILSGDHIKIEQSALATALTFAESALLVAATALEDQGIDAIRFKEYVENRLPRLGNRIIDRFPKPSDLFAST